MPRINKPECILREERIVNDFKIALIEKGWTTKHLAELCRMAPGNMSRIINHPMKVQFETILMVAKKLGIDSIKIL